MGGIIDDNIVISQHNMGVVPGVDFPARPKSMPFLHSIQAMHDHVLC